ncbi:MAG: hypothetical protein IKC69_03525, partial [Clostridia bacterium]|nr:hypothetical protein [Clostridia bacterium]
MKNETKTRSTAGRRVLLSRLAVGLLSLFLGVLLILWDMGVVELPFLVRRSRRESPTLTEEQKSEAASEEVLYFDRDGYAAQCLANLYPYPMLEDGRDKLTAAPFDRETASLVRTRISAKDYECIMGFLLSSDGVIYRGSDLARIPNSQNFRLTCWRDSNGKAVFQNRESRIYHVLNSDTLEFEPILFHSGERPFDVPMPADYLAGEEGRERFFENELFGYRVTYQEGRRDKTVTVEAQYPTAFPYSEGIAVMADGDGRVTLRNEKGEVIPMEKSLILPEKKGYEALGFHGFDHG